METPNTQIMDSLDKQVELINRQMIKHNLEHDTIWSRINTCENSLHLRYNECKSLIQRVTFMEQRLRDYEKTVSFLFIVNVLLCVMIIGILVTMIRG